jgi:cytochrome c556
MKNSLQSLVIAVATVGFVASLGMGPAFSASDDPIKTRKSVMKELSGHNKAITAFLKGNKNPKKAKALGTAGDVELRAIAVAGLAARLPGMFPKGTGKSELGDKTRAKPAIWSDWAGFQAAAKNLAAEAAKLETAAASGDKKKIGAALTTLGKSGCGGCHKKFRGPKPKKSM